MRSQWCTSHSVFCPFLWFAPYFDVHDDTVQGDETVVVKCTEDRTGVPQSPILFHPI